MPGSGGGYAFRVQRVRAGLARCKRDGWIRCSHRSVTSSAADYNREMFICSNSKYLGSQPADGVATVDVSLSAFRHVRASLVSIQDEKKISWHSEEDEVPAWFK